MNPDDDLISGASKTLSLEKLWSGSDELLSAELADIWLDWQCKMLDGIIRGVVFRPEQITPNAELSSWPNTEASEAVLLSAAAQVLKTNNAVKYSKIGYGPSKKRICDIVACSIYFQKRPIAIVAVAISVRSEPQQHAVLQLLRWGGLWIESLVKHKAEQNKKTNEFPIELLSNVLQKKSFHAASIEVVNLLANFFECERVSIGYKQGSRIRLKALSNIATFDARTQYVRSIESAMEETCEQRSTLTHPNIASDKAGMRRRAHIEFSTGNGNNSICTVPLISKEQILGAITLESTQNDAFNEKVVHVLESLCLHLAPILDFQKRDEALLSSRGMRTKVSTASRVVGNSHRTTLFAMLLIALFIFTASVTQATHEISAPTNIESSVVQLLVSPQNGYIKTVNARAGDTVKKGETIITLDDRTLTLDLQKKNNERLQAEKEYLQALALGERTNQGVLQAKIAQIDADIQLTTDSLDQTQLLAPFDGVVVSGDLSQSLGSPVEVGQVLYKIAPLEEYRVVLEVDEHDIDRFKVGSQGHLINAALPRSTYSITVDQIVPFAVTGQENNFFQVEALLNDATPLLRPGMRGIAKIELGERSLLWIWTHTLVDRIRLWLWSVGF